MSNVAKVAGQAANTLVKPLEVENVFSTYLYTGTGSDQTITNGIDLAGEGGLVWVKNRDNPNSHWLLDSERSNFASRLNTNLSGAQNSDSGAYAVPTSTGFTTKGNDANIGGSSYNYASWTFRKAPKFFDVVTYTGTGSAQNISHNLGSVPGMIIIKSTSNAFNWVVYHRGTDATAPQDYFTYLDLTNTRTNSAGPWNDTAPTATQFTVNTTSAVNFNGATFVAYLFAHNDGDGDFGPDGDADIIKCGSYTGTSSSSTINQIDLGFEPQWLLIKGADYATGWQLYDNMRGISVNANDARLYADTTAAEGQSGDVDINATGFYPASGSFNTNYQGKTYIYIAIRRGTAVPESAAEVFDVQTSTSANFVHTTGFDVDLAITGSQDGWARNAGVIDRLRGDGRSLETSNTDAESAGNAGVHEFDRSREYLNSSTSGDQVAWAWKRAPKYMDVVAYTGNSTAGRTVSHNLGVAPEMMWVKPRSATNPWQVYHSATGNTKAINFDTGTGYTSINYWYNTTPSSSEFTLGSSVGFNGSGVTYIAYLFATLAGISKVGSYTGNDSSQTIDCGFTSGARFVLIKSTTQSQPWFVFDSTRGIVAGNDPYLQLNSTAPENELGAIDVIDPHNSGFIVNTPMAGINDNNETYLFYAIA
jgi:hypothetical protein